MTPEERTAARIEGMANVLAFMLTPHLKQMNAREIEILRDSLATPFGPLAEPEIDANAGFREERRQVMRDTSDLIVDRALDFLRRAR